VNFQIRKISAGIMLATFSSCIATPSPDSPPTSTPARVPAPVPDKPVVQKTPSAPITEIDVSRLFTLRTEDKALLYDVRLPLYYKLGHIDGAILFYPKPFDEAFDREKPQMEQALRDGKEIVLYCGAVDCHDSHIVAKMIAERGIPVSVYSGGWAEWKAVGIE
jgi:rhodanese-related sulfurtransferase